MKIENDNKIKALMRKYDITYHQIARVLDVGVFTIYNWKYGKTKFNHNYEFTLLHKLRNRYKEYISELDKDISSLKNGKTDLKS